MIGTEGGEHPPRTEKITPDAIRKRVYRLIGNHDVLGRTGIFQDGQITQTVLPRGQNGHQLSFASMQGFELAEHTSMVDPLQPGEQDRDMEIGAWTLKGNSPNRLGEFNVRLEQRSQSGFSITIECERAGDKPARIGSIDDFKPEEREEIANILKLSS